MIKKRIFGLTGMVLLLSMSVASAAEFTLREIKDIALGQTLEEVRQVAARQGFQEYRERFSNGSVEIGQKGFEVEAFQERNFKNENTKEYIEVRVAAEQFGGQVTSIEYTRHFREQLADAEKLRSQIVEKAGTSPNCDNHRFNVSWSMDRNHNQKKMPTGGMGCIARFDAYSIYDLIRDVRNDEYKGDGYVGFWGVMGGVRFGEKTTANALKLTYRSFSAEVDVAKKAIPVSRALASQQKTVDKIDF